ncbi:hypothetical protein ACJX0J_009802, partial [Zea mays]
ILIEVFIVFNICLSAYVLFSREKTQDSSSKLHLATVLKLKIITYFRTNGFKPNFGWLVIFIQTLMEICRFAYISKPNQTNKMQLYEIAKGGGYKMSRYGHYPTTSGESHHSTLLIQFIIGVELFVCAHCLLISKISFFY